MDSTIMLADSGASCNVSNSLDGMFELQKVEATIKVGNGNKMTGTMKGKWKGVVVRADGTTQDVTFGEVIMYHRVSTRSTVLLRR